jgi:hypothetical protein
MQQRPQHQMQRGGIIGKGFRIDLHSRDDARWRRAEASILSEICQI